MKKRTKENRAAVEQTMALAYRVETARPGDVVFITPGRPLPEQAMQHLSQRFKAANLGVKVVIMQSGHRVEIEPAEIEPETIEERAQTKYAVSSAEWSSAPTWDGLDEDTRNYYRKAVAEAIASERVREENAG